MSCAKKKLIRDQVIYDTTDKCLLIAHAEYTWYSLSSLLNTPGTVNTSAFTLWFFWNCKSPASVTNLVLEIFHYHGMEVLLIL